MLTARERATMAAALTNELTHTMLVYRWEYDSVGDPTGVRLVTRKADGSTFSGTVPCYIIATPNVDGPLGPVVAKEINIFTLDKVDFPAGYDVRSLDLIAWTTPTDSDWSVIDGAPQKHATLQQYWAYAAPTQPPSVILT